MPHRESPCLPTGPTSGPLRNVCLALLSWVEAAWPALRVLEHVDASVDLQGRPQFDVHSTHQMVLLEQQQGLPVDFLGTEFLRYLLAA